MNRQKQAQHGFALLGALFVLVVLGGLGAMMVNLSSVQHSTVTMAVQGSRAYHASRAGLEWGIYRALAGQCAASNSYEVDHFQVTVTCRQQSVAESTVPYAIYRLHSTARIGAYGSPNFVQRQMEVKIVDKL